MPRSGNLVPSHFEGTRCVTLLNNRRGFNAKVYLCADNKSRAAIQSLLDTSEVSQLLILAIKSQLNLTEIT